MKQELVFGFFGFYREGHKYSYNFDIKSQEYKKYIFTPTILNEDTDKTISEEQLIKKFGNRTKIELYKYDKQKHIDYCKLFTKDKFINRWYQQGYRIFSFFYNIKGVLKLMKEEGNYKPDDVIILCRIDVGLNIVNKNKIFELLNKYDILVTRLGNTFVHDKVFVFKYRFIDILIKLYDDFGMYIKQVKNNEKSRPSSTRPEDIFYYHFKQNNMNIAQTNFIKFYFHHVCSKFCGHHGKNTKT